MTQLTLTTWCNPLISCQTTVNVNAKLKFRHNEVVNHVQNGKCSRSDLSQIRSVTNQYFLHLQYHIRIQWLGNFNIRRMSNAVKLRKIRQRSNSNSNFVTSLPEAENLEAANLPCFPFCKLASQAPNIMDSPLPYPHKLPRFVPHCTPWRLRCQILFAAADFCAEWTWARRMYEMGSLAWSGAESRCGGAW